MLASRDKVVSEKRTPQTWMSIAGAREHKQLNNIPVQTALPLRALALCGYAEDPRAERAYAWLDATRLADGAWPTGYAKGNLRGVAGYRRIAHSEWGCRSNTTAVLQCLAYHPQRAKSEAARRALDLLLGRETRDAHVFGFETARTLGAEPATGFLTYFARFDIALMLDLAGRVGANRDDDRIEAAVQFALALREENGLWRYALRPQSSRWLTFSVLASLQRLDQASDWLPMEPRTPFAPYPSRRPRY